MALAERTWERVGERKRDRARLIESTAFVSEVLYNICIHVVLNIQFLAFGSSLYIQYNTATHIVIVHKDVM